MRGGMTVDDVRRELRARVCRVCARRASGTPGDTVDVDRPLECEVGCDLFIHLPQLTRVARQLDPMISSYDKVLRHRIQQILESIAQTRFGGEGKPSPLNRHRRRVVRTLAELASNQSAADLMRQGRRPPIVGSKPTRGQREES